MSVHATDSNKEKKREANPKERPDNPAFTPVSINAMIRAIEKNNPNFSTMFGMFLGFPTLTLIALTEKYQADGLHSDDTVTLGGVFFREWLNKKKQAGVKEADRYRDVIAALTGLDKGLYAEIMQQRYIDELPMKYEDFQVLM